MSVRSGQSVTVLFTTRVFATGIGTNADSLPSGTLYLNGTANGATVTVTNISTGLYKAAVTLPTLAVNDEVEIIIAATVSLISDSAVIWGDTKDVFAGAIPDIIAGGSGGLFIAGSNAATTVNITGNITGNISGSIGSVTSGVTVTTNNDKTGYTASTVSDKTGYTLTSSYDFAKGTVAMAESYAAQGATLTPSQALYGITQQLGQQSIAGTVMTVQKRDGATTAKTYNLNSATTPTAITEAT